VNIQPTQASAQQGQPVSWDAVAPAQLVQSNLGPVSMARPQNWQVFQDQQGGGITIAPRAGLAGNAIGYGVVLNGVRPNGNLDQTTSSIVRSLQGGGDLRQIGNAQPITVGSSRGRSVMMESTSPFPGTNGSPQKERDWLVTAPAPDGSVVYFVFVAPASDFERLRPTFESMLRSAML